MYSKSIMFRRTVIFSALSCIFCNVQAQELQTNIPTQTLPTIIVEDAKIDNNEKQNLSTKEIQGYKGGNTRVGKSSQNPKDIPQSVTIVSEKLIQDKNAYTMKEALRNVAGLTFNAGEGGRIGDNITIRGYSAVGDLYLDGMRDIAQYNRETFNLSQIDVLKGSSSMLFGRGSTGGLINQVSKTPKLKSRYEANATFGSDNYLRQTIDLNQNIADNTSVRFNAMNTKTDSFRDGVEQKRFGIAPTVSFGIGTKSELTLAYYLLKENNTPDYGVPYFNGTPINVPTSRFYGLPTDKEQNTTKIATAIHTYAFDNGSNLRTSIRAADYDRDLYAIAPRIVGNPIAINDNTLINRQRQARGGSEKTFTLQSDFNTKFNTKNIEHAVLIGTEYTHEKAERWSNTSSISNPQTNIGNTATVNLPANFMNTFSKTAFNSYKGDSLGIYLQDTISLTPKFKVLLGTRFDTTDADYKRPMPQGNLSRGDNVWSYKGGLIYQPSENNTNYLAYGTSFNTSAELYQLDDRTKNTPPEKSRNIELGTKWEVLNKKLSLRAALFRTEKTNERNTDLATPDIALLSGKRHTNGIELEANGRITDKWDIFASTALMRGKIDEASGQQANTKGMIPINTPKYTYSLWSTYKLMPNFKLGAGIEGVGKRYGNATNTNYVPSYNRVDAMAEYSLKNYSIKANIFNLMNKKYYESVYSGHAVAGTSRAFQVTLSAKF